MFLWAKYPFIFGVTFSTSKTGFPLDTYEIKPLRQMECKVIEFSSNEYEEGNNGLENRKSFSKVQKQRTIRLEFHQKERKERKIDAINCKLLSKLLMA